MYVLLLGASSSKKYVGKAAMLLSTLVFLPNVARNFAISTSYLFTLFGP